MSTPNSIIPIITNIMIITIVEGSIFSFDVVGAAVVGTLVGAAVVGAPVVGTLVGAAVSPKFSTFICFAVSTRANEVCARTKRFAARTKFGRDRRSQVCARTKRFAARTKFGRDLRSQVCARTEFGVEGYGGAVYGEKKGKYKKKRPIEPRGYHDGHESKINLREAQCNRCFLNFVTVLVDKCRRRLKDLSKPHHRPRTKFAGAKRQIFII